MNCPKCHLAISEDSTFCEHCGDRVESDKIPSIENTPPVAANPSSELTIKPQEQEPHLWHVYPWRRYFARMLDYTWFGLLCNATLLQLSLNLGFNNQFGYALLYAIVWIFVESAFLSSVGTTPGKFLFSTKVRSLAGEKLSYGSALTRSVDVWVSGTGLGIPIVGLFTMLDAKKKLESTHTTHWDQKSSSVVIHKDLGFARGLFLCVSLIGLLMGYSYLNYKPPIKWTPFYATDAQFKILFPTPPQRSADDKSYPNSTMKNSMITYMSSPDDKTAYMICAHQLSEDIAKDDPSDILNILMNDSVQGVEGGELISSKFITVKGINAIEYLVKEQTQNVRMKLRILLINKREYFTYGVAYKDANPPDYDRFVDSFQLMGTH